MSEAALNGLLAEVHTDDLASQVVKALLARTDSVRPQALACIGGGQGVAIILETL